MKTLDSYNALRFYLRYGTHWLRYKVLVLPSRVAVLCFVAALLTWPLLDPNPYWLRILSMAAIFALLTASWDFLSGVAGQMNLGQGLFFGAGAYGAAFLNIHWELPLWLTIPLGGVVAIFSGLLIGIPCLRLRGSYLSLTTLVFPIIILGLIYYFSDWTGGELGLFGVEGLSRSRVASYYWIVSIMLGSCFILWKIADSKTGLLFHALREDEVALRSMGINTIRYKLLAFCVSAFFSGIAGALYAHFIRLAGPSTFEILTSFQVVIWGIFGGIASIYGAVGGVFLLFPLLEYLRILPELRTLVFAGLVLLTLLYMPEGLFPRVRDALERICPRCKLRNFRTRKYCRVCTSEL